MPPTFIFTLANLLAFRARLSANTIAIAALAEAVSASHSPPLKAARGCAFAAAQPAVTPLRVTGIAKPAIAGHTAGTSGIILAGSVDYANLAAFAGSRLFRRQPRSTNTFFNNTPIIAATTKSGIHYEFYQAYRSPGNN
jgi:hypothetical protein